jgi:ribosomal protein S12 methylthiotransferase accessory factor
MNRETPFAVFDLAQIRSRYQFAQLVRPHVGLTPGVVFLPLRPGEPDFQIASADLGDLTEVFPHIRASRPPGVSQRPIGGAAADVTAEQAWVRAVGEAAERYATVAFSPEDFVTATARDVGSEGIDLLQIARCSETEYADPKCPLRPAPLDAPIRWVRGYSLVSEREILVPAVMAHLHIQAWPAERFWLPISTGVAAHTDLASAVMAAACEVVERDALALAWLARLPLTRVGIGSPAPEPIADLTGRFRNVRQQLQFFDATTDFGVPTVLLVQVLRGHPTAEVLVACASAAEAHVACAKAIKEAAACVRVMSAERLIPSAVVDFYELTHGADYYARGGHLDDFAFLFGSGRSVSLDAMNDAAGVTPGAAPRDALRHLVGTAKRLGFDLIAVDLTTDELRDAGLWVIRVIAPALVPISFVYRARYLGTPRIYSYAERVLGGCLCESDINPGPLPFA